MNDPVRFSSPEYLTILDARPSDQTCFIHAQHQAFMSQEAQEGYPLEVCGLLIGRYDKQGWHIEDVRAVPNLNQERAADRFELDPRTYQKIDRSLRGTGQEIIGVYHSHPDCPAKPSPTDLSSAWPCWAYIIVRVQDGQAVDIQCWEVKEDSQKFCHVPIMEL
ncbi:MAG: M67 family metallopeptidase [Mariprofundaceae bacterium]|nr:M67 family metallopeptidase [Mariprofundaceae bacterium]